MNNIPQSEKVWNLINSGWTVTSKQVAETTKIKWDSCSAILSILKKAGLLEVVSKTNKGLYSYRVTPQNQNKAYNDIKHLIYKARKPEYAKTKAKRRKLKAKTSQTPNTAPKNTIYKALLISTLGEFPRKMSRREIRAIFEDALSTLD